MRKLIILLIAIATALILTNCTKKEANEVVVYTSLDQIFSGLIINEFEKKTGLKVKAVYDIEAVKTTEVVQRSFS